MGEAFSFTIISTSQSAFLFSHASNVFRSLPLLRALGLSLAFFSPCFLQSFLSSVLSLLSPAHLARTQPLKAVRGVSTGIVPVFLHCLARCTPFWLLLLLLPRILQPQLPQPCCNFNSVDFHVPNTKVALQGPRLKTCRCANLVLSY